MRVEVILTEQAEQQPCRENVKYASMCGHVLIQTSRCIDKPTTQRGLLGLQNPTVNLCRWRLWCDPIRHLNCEKLARLCRVQSVWKKSEYIKQKTCKKKHNITMEIRTCWNSAGLRCFDRLFHPVIQVLWVTSTCMAKLLQHKKGRICGLNTRFGRL